VAADEKQSGTRQKNGRQEDSTQENERQAFHSSVYIRV
jgi:hypothetical protein